MFIEAVREWRSRTGWLSDLKDPARWLFYGLYGGVETSSGVVVGPKTALENPPALRAIRLIGESLSSVPLNEMEQLADSRKKRVLREDPTHWLVHAEPNEMMNSAVLRQVIQLHTLTYGNGYIFIERQAATNRPSALLPLPPETTRPVLEKGRFFYETRGADNQTLALNPRDVIHLPWLSWDGLRGESPSLVGKRTIALGIAARESTARFFGQGMLNSGVIEQAPNTSLKQEGLDNLRAAIEAKFAGVTNFWHPLLLQAGLSWKQISVDMDKAQASQLLELNVADAARTYGVPLHLLASLQTGAQSYASVEQFGLIFIKHTMLPWFFLWEQELNRKLLFPEERSSRFFKFNLEGLLRGDKPSRAAANKIELEGGALTVNEWRDLEDRDPSTIPEADEPLIMASQMAPLSQVGRPVEPAAASPRPAREEDLVQRLYEQQARRCARQLADSAGKIKARYGEDAPKCVAELREAVSRIAEDYGDVFERAHFDWFLRQCQEPGCIPVAAQFWREYGASVLLGKQPEESRS